MPFKITTKSESEKTYSKVYLKLIALQFEKGKI